MSKLDSLNALYVKSKKSGKLNKIDSEEAKKLILELLNEDQTKEIVLKNIIMLPEEVGISSYFDYYKTLDNDLRKQLNIKFLNSEEFKANTGGRSVNRGIFLIGILCKEKLILEIKYILMKITNLMVANKAKTIPDKYIETFRKNILNNYNKELFSIPLENLNDDDYNKIQTIILNVSFRQIKDEIVKPAIQCGALGWLLKSNRNITLKR